MKIDRRNFIKLGAVGSGALVLPNPLKKAEKDRTPWNRQQARCLRKFRNPRPTTCALCENHCGLISYREGDRIVMLHGNSEHPVNHGKVCARAYGQLNRLYDPDRVLKPRLRVGKRGAGQWREISWNEAYQIVVDKLTPLRDNGGAGLALVMGRSELLGGQLAALFPEALLVKDEPEAQLKSLRTRLYGVKGCFRDLSGSRFILNFAADPMIRGLNMLADSRGLVEARNRNGAKMVTVGARLNNTGGRSDYWLPVAPSAYGTLARSLAACLLEEKLFDRQALLEHNLDLDELRASLRQYRPDQVAAGMNLKPEQIVKLAREMARLKPAQVVYDEELLQAPDGLHSAAAAELLNLLLGAVNRPGGIFYYDEENGPAAAIGRDQVVRKRQSVSLDWFANWLQERGNKPVVISYVANPAYVTYSGRYPHALWRNPYKIPYHIAIDTHVSETSVFADLILPAATELETWGISDRPLLDGRRVLSLRQPVARIVDEILLLRQAKEKNLDLFTSKRRPVAESRDFNQIVLDLRQLFKGAALEEAPRVKQWLEQQFSSPLWQQLGVEWRQLEKQGFQTYQPQKQTYSRLSPTVRDNSFLPFVEKVETQAGDRFTLIPYRWHVLDNATANCRHLAEFRHDNPVWIHPERAARLGIREGDKLQLETENGAVESRAWLTEAIHPECLATALGLGHTGIGRVAKAEKIADSDPMTRSLLLHNPLHFTPFSFRLRAWDPVEPVWWHKKGNGADVRRIFKAEPDPQIAGMTTVDTTVRLRKL